MKYFTPNTDYSALQRELSGAKSASARYPEEPAEPSFTSTVQSAGGVYPDRSILKAPELSLLPICTPSTVIARPAAASACRMPTGQAGKGS